MNVPSLSGTSLTLRLPPQATPSEIAMSAMSGETETSYGSAPGKWSAYMRDLFRTRQPPPLGSVDPDKIEAAAREKLKDSPGESYAYARTAIPAFHSESRVSPPGPAIVPRWVDASS